MDNFFLFYQNKQSENTYYIDPYELMRGYIGQLTRWRPATLP
jgi:hypothetical protein